MNKLRNHRPTTRTLLSLAGLALILFGIFLPTGWYDQLPEIRADVAEPPIRGVTLLRLCFGFEGMGLLLIGLVGKFRPGIRPEELLSLQNQIGKSPVRRPLVWLGLITVLGAGLRIYDLNSDLWLDEITTLLGYRDMSFFHVLTAYVSSNNHLLNTVLIKASVALFGPEEWSIRLPAVLFGIGSVPALYFLARIALSRRDSLLASFMLAVSYHHIFFSQNARGYSGYLFWSILATAFFLKLVSQQSSRNWYGYVVCMVLGLATILYSWFVLAGHMLSGLAIMFALQRQGKAIKPVAWRAISAWAVIGLLGFQIYASIIPQVYVYIQNVYFNPGAGYSLFSPEYLQELTRGLTQGFGGVAIFLLPLLLVFGYGAALSLRRHWVFGFTLLAPLMVLTAYLILQQSVVSPRFFLWTIPVAFVFAALLHGEVYSWLKSRPGSMSRSANGMMILAVLAVSVISLVSLNTYYRVPKQANQEMVNWISQNREQGDVLAAVYLSEWGLRFYGPAAGIHEKTDYQLAPDIESLRQIEATAPGRRIILTTTLMRAVRLGRSDLYEHITNNYSEIAQFPATIGDGEITIWERRIPSAGAETDRQ